MSSITYEDVEAYYKSHVDDWSSLLNKVEKYLIKARDEGGLPLYSTKCRVKTQESIYLKSKRKSKPLELIEDYAGLRVLCLFEEDIIKVNSFIISMIKSKNMILKEMKIYNFDEGNFVSALVGAARQILNEEKLPKPEIKMSGYKSIHYIVYDNDGVCPLEIQLRTLLQDVWGELEHSLSYKRGMIHPHIKKSFVLLARDIETSDMLMSHLKSIHSKEVTKDKYGIQKSGVRNYFMYDDEVLPEELRSESFVSAWNDYAVAMKSAVLTWGLDGGCKAVGRQLKALKESLIKSHPDQVDAASNLNYWIKMEEALHVFLSKDYDRALKKYKRLLDDYEDRYVLHFRIGEIYFIESNITQALRSFDASERLIHAAMIRKPGCRILMQNMAIIKRKLSYAYWMLGDEYIDKSIALMQDVEKLLIENHESFDNYDQHVVLTYNNLCWYMTCKWQACLKEWKALNGVSGDAKHGKCLSLQGDAKDYFEKLVDAIESNKSKSISVPSNCLDTAAFFCYLMYCETMSSEYKDQAKKYAVECDHGTNYATLSLTSISIQINHITDIMSLPN